MTEQSDPLKVFISHRDSSCEECGEELGRRAWITLAGEHGALCLACADLDHLVFLPSGDAALTRRARKHSKLAAVVLKWSLARKRYERTRLARNATRREVEPPSDLVGKPATLPRLRSDLGAGSV